MEILNKNKKRSYKEIKNNLSLKRIILISLILIGMILFGFGNLVYGAYLNSTGRTYNLKLALQQISNFNFSFVPNTINGQLTKVKQFDLDISFKNWEKIRYNREKALINGVSILKEFKEDVPAKIRFKNETYKVKIALTGGNMAHINHPSKWSLMVKVKNGKTIMGMNKFALLYPRGRGYLTDWFATRLLQSRNIIGLQTGFANLNINGKDRGLYYLEERFDSNLLEKSNQFYEGIVFRPIGSNLKIYGYDRIKENSKLFKDAIHLKQLWYSFLNDSIKPEQIFDLKKFASLYVCTDIMYNPSEAHALWYGNLRFYFNPITKLVEPIAREWGSINKFDHKPLEKLLIENRLPDIYKLQKKISNNLTFKELYIKEAELLTKKSFLDSIIEIHRTEMDQLLNEIHTQNPFYEFPIHILYENQENIRKKIDPFIPPLDVYFDSIKNNELNLQIVNRSDLPIEIKYLVYNDKKIILPDEKIIAIPKFEVSNIFQKINIPVNSIDNIELSKLSMDSIEVVFSILGLNETNKNYYRHIYTSKTIILPNKNSFNYSSINPIQKVSNIYDFDFLEIKNRIITFSDSICEVNKDLIIPIGYAVKTKPGCTINITNSAKIISHSPLLFFGNKEKPITVTSSDLTGRGIIVFNSKPLSEFTYVNFNSLSSIKDDDWKLNGVITFYESSININHCSFNKNITGNSYLNIIRSNFNILNSSFINTFQNALSIDFCTGEIESVLFQNINDIALNINESELLVTDLEIKKSFGVGIRGEKNSYVVLKNIKLNQNNVAIISKDNTTININNIDIDSTNLAFSVFTENSGYGPGIMNIEKSTLKNIKKDYLIEVNSSLTINGEKINNTTKKVEEKLKKYEGK